jgi:hypothetical protein
MSLRFSRRQALRAAFAGLAAAPAFPLAGRAALAAGVARRVIFFYFPDGVPAPAGGPNLWTPTGSETSFQLPSAVSALEPFKSKTVFFKGLSMGGTDVGSHPGGAKKLLTGVDGGNGESIDRYLARTFGASAPFNHVYLGAQAAIGNASGDKFISYPSAGTTAPPEDDPRRAFARLFGNAGTTTNTGGGGTSADTEGVSILDAAQADLDALRQKLGTAEKAKLDQHTDALRDLERRLAGMTGSGGPAPPASCSKPTVDTRGVSDGGLTDPAMFPAILRSQVDVMITAMACGLTKVGVIQGSQHTSELVMSRFAGTDLYKPNFDMRSHQASHYGDPSDSKFSDYGAQRHWFVGELAYLLGELQKRPEDAGTMLDYSIVVLCTEVSDGNTHSHDDMPFLVCGGGGGALRTGRFLDVGYLRHSSLLLSLARATGDKGLASFGQECKGPVPGLLT